MKTNSTKYVLIAGAIVVVFGGLIALNRKQAAPQEKPKVVAVAESGVDLNSKQQVKAPVEQPKPEAAVASNNKGTSTAQDYGLAPLTMENVDFNPEKPAEMPLELWEDYERQRYEMVQLKAYKFRKTDPSKVKPAEIKDSLPEAAKKYDIPEDLLAALLYTSSDGGHHYAEHDIEGGFGLMMLKESPQCDSLGEAAQLLGVEKEDLIYDQRLNVLGGAAVLRQYFDDAKASGLEDSEAWYMAISQYSGRPQPDLAAALADQVAGNLIKGFEIDSEDGSGYYYQEANSTPLFNPRNWRLAGVDPPAGAANNEQANASGAEGAATGAEAPAAN